MRSRSVAHANGRSDAAPQSEPAMPPHLAAMASSDEVEQHIAQLRQRIAALSFHSSSPAAAAAVERSALSAELELARLRLSTIRANGRYLALLSCVALLVAFIVFLLCGWQSPIVHLHRFINSASSERMARMGVTEEQLTAQRDDQAFVSAFDWWSWLLPYESAGKQRQT